MPISKSSFALGTPRADGLVPCTETHVTEFGQATLSYAAPADSDWQGHLNETAAHIKGQLAEAEFERALVATEPFQLKNQTQAQFLTKFRSNYRSANRAEGCAMATWLLRRMAAGSVTEAQVRTAFGLSDAARYAKFKARLEQQQRAWTAFLAALGED